MESKTGNVKEEATRYRLVQLSCETVSVTPEMAARWLADNPHNRPIRKERVDELCEKIRSGKWKLNPPIEVFDTGRLWNGQHRLSAIVKTGRSVKMKVRTLSKIPEETIGQ